MTGPSVETWRSSISAPRFAVAENTDLFVRAAVYVVYRPQGTSSSVVAVIRLSENQLSPFQAPRSPEGRTDAMIDWRTDIGAWIQKSRSTPPSASG